MFENPYIDEMDEKRLYLLDYYELMNKCVETNLGLHPRMTSEDLMTECCGRNFRIMVHEFNQTMRRVAEMYETILRHKFGLLGEGYEKEIEEFLANMNDFVKRDFQVKESVALSIRGAKMIVDEKLYQDLITSSEKELQELEEYRLELKRGRDKIMIGIRILFTERDKQIEEMLKREEEEAKKALEEEKKKQEAEELRNKAAAQFDHDDSEDEEGRSGDFDDSSENSEETNSSDSEGSANDSDEDEEHDDSEEKGENFDDIENKDEETEDSNIDYDAMSSNEKVFDEFRDIDEEKKAINDIQEGQIEEEWERLKKEKKLDPRLGYVDDDSHLQEIDHSMKTDM
jgi:hypothetical protein